MDDWQKWLWDGLGWSMFGPLGGILDYAMGTKTELEQEALIDEEACYPQTRAGDFGISLLVLLPVVMQADRKIHQSELDFAHSFFARTFGTEQARDLMALFQNILEQDYSLQGVCRQIHKLMDHPSRLEMVHLLFGLAQADAHMDPEEVQVIREITGDLGISQPDFESIQAMFVKDAEAPYRILQVDREAGEETLEQAYRDMIDNYHPDKVSHLGEEFRELAEEKFKIVEEAYRRIREERGWI